MVRLLCSQTQGRWHQTNVLVTQQDLELFKLCHWFTQLNTNRNSGFWAIIWYFGNTTVVQFNLINVTSTTNNVSAQKEADLHDIHSLPMTRSWGKSKLDLSRTSQYIYFYVWWSCLVVSCIVLTFLHWAGRTISCISRSFKISNFYFLRHALMMNRSVMLWFFCLSWLIEQSPSLGTTRNWWNESFL